MAVRLGDREAPFRLDARLPGARVQLDGEEYAVRALRWKDKRWLARFAALGPQWIESEFVATSLAEGEAPTEPDALRMLAALAQWLNDPADSGESLPLEAGALTRATLDLCRLTGLGPEALDEQPANEVEAMWSAERRTLQDTTGEGSTDAGVGAFDTRHTTRIEIVPDPPSDTAAPAVSGGDILSDERGASDDEVRQGRDICTSRQQESSGRPPVSKPPPAAEGTHRGSDREDDSGIPEGPGSSTRQLRSSESLSSEGEGGVEAGDLGIRRNLSGDEPEEARVSARPHRDRRAPGARPGSSLPADSHRSDLRRRFRMRMASTPPDRQDAPARLQAGSGPVARSSAIEGQTTGPPTPFRQGPPDKDDVLAERRAQGSSDSSESQAPPRAVARRPEAERLPGAPRRDLAAPMVPDAQPPRRSAARVHPTPERPEGPELSAFLVEDHLARMQARGEPRHDRGAGVDSSGLDTGNVYDTADELARDLAEAAEELGLNPES